MMSDYGQRKVVLEFTELRVEIDNREVIAGVSGVARPGQLLAIMGPSGAGKTVLLSCLAGRQPHTLGGTVRLNGRPITKRLRRHISFVLQEDLFFDNLTLEDTLMFTAQLRLPGSMTSQEKRRKVDNIVETLDLRKCLHTKIGNSLRRGLSGGEKKRTNIGCELLTDPAILLLDEPTSGLDSRAASDLMEMLKKYAVTSQKTIVTSIHQPSSHVFHLFDHLLLLSEGEVVYFGDAGSVLDYFSGLGLYCPQHYNPADFIIDKIKRDTEELSRIRRASRGRRWRLSLQARGESSMTNGTYNNNASTHSQGKVNPALSVSRLMSEELSDTVFIGGFDDVDPRTTRPENNAMNMSDASILSPDHHEPISMSPSPDHVTSNGLPKLESATLAIEQNGGGDHGDGDTWHTAADDDDDNDWMDGGAKWQAGFWRQLATLTRRNFKQNRSVVLSKLDIIKQLSIAFVMGALWFQVSHDEEGVANIAGMAYFYSAYWGFESIFSVLTSFSDERDVIYKERSAGTYRLSTYYLSKLIGMFPLRIALPIASATIAFWMVGLHRSVLAFLCFTGTTLLYTQVGQAIGLFISAISTSAHQAIVIASVTMLTSMLLGGLIYVTSLPPALAWLRYVSFTSYMYGALLSDIFIVIPQQIRCSSTFPSSYPDCAVSPGLPNITTPPSTTISTVMSTANVELEMSGSQSGYISGEEVVASLVSFVLPNWAYHAVLAGFALTFNLLAYLTLRFVRHPP